MIDLKNIFQFIFILFVLVIFTSCGYDIHVSEEVIKEQLSRNETVYKGMVTDFLNQDQILSITRRSYRFIPGGKIYNLFNLYNTEYSIVATGLEPQSYFRFEVNGNEKHFLEQDYKNILYSNDNLLDFLNRHKIDINFLKKLIEIMIEENIYSISKEKTDEAIKIRFGLLDGLLYSLKQNMEIDNTRFEQIIRLKDDWYYFRERH